MKNNLKTLRVLPIILMVIYFLGIKKMNLSFEMELGYLVMAFLISVSVLYFLFKEGLLAKQRLVTLLVFIVLSVCIGGYFYYGN
jgi:hypothetical protein